MQYVGVINGEIVCHTGIIQFPMRKGCKRVHRLVVLPDYQGIGIGTAFIKEVAKMITKEGFELNATISPVFTFITIDVAVFGFCSSIKCTSAFSHAF